MKKKPQKGAGRNAGTGNVTIDLGEEIDKKLRATTMAGRGARSGASHRPGGYRPGTYRPGMFGGYRPWYSGSRWELGKVFGLPDNAGKTSELLTGAVVGLAGGRALVRVTPDIINTTSRLANEALAFGIGIIPYMVKKNSTTLGVAIPGFVFLGGALVDFALSAVGVPRPVLSGNEGARRIDANVAARQKLADIQARINQGARGGSPLPRVVAQPVYS